MPHDKQGYITRYELLYKGGYVGEHCGCRTCEAFLGRLCDGAAPAPLVEGVHFYGGEGEGGEEGAVGVAVVAEAVDEDEARFWGGFGLWVVDLAVSNCLAFL